MEHSGSELYPSDIANILKELDEDELKRAIPLIPDRIVGYVALELPDRYFHSVIESLSDDKLIEAIEEMESDDQVEFIQELSRVDGAKALKLFRGLNIEDQRDIQKLLSYEEHEAGAYMQTEVFTAKEHERVQDAIDRFSKLKRGGKIENVHTVFITTEDGKLLYGIDLDDILTFNFTKTFYENIQESEEHFEPIKAYDKEDIYRVVEYFKKYDLSVIAVVNSSGILVGRITSDDIYDIINEQATEQMYNLAGVDDEAEEDEDVVKATKTRANWLGINLFTAILASFVIGAFQETIDSMVLLQY